MGREGEVLDWFAAGRIEPGREIAVLRSAGMVPNRKAWLSFLSRLFLWLGTLALGAAVIFFFAFNWAHLSRLAKIGLAEGAIVAGLLACWRLDLNGVAGKAVLTLLAVLVGALLALTGQIYQSGADTFELFAWWAVLILPWVVVGRFAPLWLLWLALLNIAVFLYGSLGDKTAVLWNLFALNGLALIAWEAGRRAGVAWMREAWPPRLIALASTATATAVFLWGVIGTDTGAWMVIGRGEGFAALAIVAYLVWLAAIYGWYRHVRPDLLMLAAAVLSLIVAAVTVVMRSVVETMGMDDLLLIGLLVIGMSTLGGMWLKTVAREIAA